MVSGEVQTSFFAQHLDMGVLRSQYINPLRFFALILQPEIKLSVIYGAKQTFTEHNSRRVYRGTC